MPEAWESYQMFPSKMPEAEVLQKRKFMQKLKKKITVNKNCQFNHL